MDKNNTESAGARLNGPSCNKLWFTISFGCSIAIWMMYACTSPLNSKDKDSDESRLIWSYKTVGWIATSPALATDECIIFAAGDSSLYSLWPDGTLRWRFSCEAKLHDASPSIGDNGTIYIGCSSGQLFAISPDGELEWTFNTGNSIRHSVAIGSDGTIYCVAEGTVYAISPTGELIWSYSKYLFFGSPAIGADGTIYVGSSDRDAFMGNQATVLHALDPDGSLKWDYRSLDGGSTPAIGHNSTIYITCGDSSLHAINPEGQLKWRYQTNSALLSGASIGTDGVIYFGTWEYYLYAIREAGDLGWKCELRRVTPNVLTVGSDGTIYAGCDSLVYAVDPSGTILWQYHADGIVSRSSPVLTDSGILYIVSTDGELFALATDSPSLAESPWPKFQANNQNTGRR